MPSLRRLATYYLSYPNGFSVLREVFGYDEPPRTLSLRERLRYLESFADLRVMLIQKWIDNWEDNDQKFGLSVSDQGGLKSNELEEAEAKAIGEKSFRRIAAGLMALKDIEHFDEPYTIKGTLLADPMSEKYFPKQVEQWVTNDFLVIGETGSVSKIPYDFVMKEIVSLLYVFRDDDALLTDNSCYQLIDRGFAGRLNESFGEHLKYKIPVPWWVNMLLAAIIIGGVIGFALAVALIPALASVAAIITPALILAIAHGLYYPETENHVLISYSSIHLARQWVKQNSRRDSRFDKARYANIQDNQLDNQIEDLLLQASGRILHNGFFETNGREYAAFSVQPLACLHSFNADEKLQLAARNALDFAWSICAFRSYFQRTYSPFRRNNEVADNVSTYGTGNISMVAPFFAPPRPQKQVFDSDFWDRNMGNPAGFTLWTMLFKYRPHEVITDFAIKENLFMAEKGYWARMQARYTKDHYKQGQRPQYFDPDGNPFGASSNIKSTPEFCFVHRDFMNAGGGKFDRYKVRYDNVLASFKNSPKDTHEYDFIARPQVAFVERALLEFEADGSIHDGEAGGNGLEKKRRERKRRERLNRERKDDMRQKIMFMFGHNDFWLSDNSGMYKGFSCGYFKHRGTDDRHSDFPMNIPPGWLGRRLEEDNEFVFRNSSTSRVVFTFYDLTQDGGPYVVTGRASKKDGARKYRAYARGFWELVPGNRFDSVSELKDWVLQHNPDAHFSNSLEGDQRFYIYTMTTGESLQLNHLLGHDQQTNPIRNIWASGKTPLVDEPIKLSQFVANHQSSPDVKSMPLLQVREVDEQSEFTGMVYAIAKGDGRLRVTNPFMNFEFTVDSNDYKNPVRAGNTIA